MTGLIVEDTYPSHRHTLTTCTGTEHSGHAAKNMFSRKNGAQQSTNMKKTRPNTLLAFCSVATAFAANDLLFVLPGRNLGRTRTQRLCLPSGFESRANRPPFACANGFPCSGRVNPERRLVHAQSCVPGDFGIRTTSQFRD